MEFCYRLYIKSFLFIAFFSSFFIDSIKGQQSSHPGMKYFEMIRIYAEVKNVPSDYNFSWNIFSGGTQVNTKTILDKQVFLENNGNSVACFYGAFDRYTESLDELTIYNSIEGGTLVFSPEQQLTIHKNDPLNTNARVGIIRYIIPLIELECDNRIVCESTSIPYRVVSYKPEFTVLNSMISYQREYIKPLGNGESPLNKEFSLIAKQNFDNEGLRGYLYELFSTKLTGFSKVPQISAIYTQKHFRPQVEDFIYSYNSGRGYFVLSPPNISIKLNSPTCNGGQGSVTINNIPLNDAGTTIQLNIKQLYEDESIDLLGGNTFEVNHPNIPNKKLYYGDGSTQMLEIPAGQTFYTFYPTDLDGKKGINLKSGWYIAEAIFFDAKNKGSQLCSFSTDPEFMYQPDPLALSLENQPIVEGSSYHTKKPGGTGVVKIIASGGRDDATYKYKIGAGSVYTNFNSDSPTSKILDNLKNGNVIYLSNSYGCEAVSETISFTEPDTLKVTISDEALKTHAPTCSSENESIASLKSNGKITFNTSGGVGENSYKLFKKGANNSWTQVSGASAILQSGEADVGNEKVLHFSGLENGTYKVKVTDFTISGNGTTVESGEKKLVRDAIPVGLVSSDEALACYGGTTTIPFNADPESVYSSYGYILNEVSISYTDILEKALGANIYTIAVSKDGCSKTLSFSVTQPSTPLNISIQEADITPDICKNGNGKVTFSIVGGQEYDYPYYVTIDDISQAPKTINKDESLSDLYFDGLAAGQYTLKVYSGGSPNSHNCTAEKIIKVNAKNPLSSKVSVSDVKKESCEGKSDAVIKISGVDKINEDYYLYWGVSKDKRKKVEVDSNNQLTGLTKGEYSLLVKEIGGNSCEYENTIAISVSENHISIESVEPLIPATCKTASNGSATINVSGGVGPESEIFYSKDNFSTKQSANLISNLTHGSYTLYVKDAAGCVAQTKITIKSDSVPITWSNPVASPASCVGASNGYITLSNVKHSNKSKSLTYYKDEEPFSGSEAEFSKFFKNLAPGNYNVKVADEDGCFVTEEVEVKSNDYFPDLSFEVITPVACVGKSTGQIGVTIKENSLASPDFSIDLGWMNDRDFVKQQSYSGKESSTVFQNLTNKEYTIKVKDGNNCSASFTYTPTLQSPALTLTEKWIPANCSKVMGAIELSAQGGTPFEGGKYDFYFADKLEDVGSKVIINKIPGTQGQVKVVDAAGCVVLAKENKTVFVRENPVEITDARTVSPSCIDGDDGKIEFDLVGDPKLKYYYILTDRDDPTFVVSEGITPGEVSIHNLSARIYNLTVLEAPLNLESSDEDIEAGCSSDYPGIEVKDYVPIIVEEFSNNYIEYFGEVTGSMEVTISGGSDSYIYELENKEDKALFFDSGGTAKGKFSKVGLPAGAYTFRIKDINDCKYFDNSEWYEHEFTIEQPDEALSLQKTILTNLTCYNSGNGRIEVEAKGGWREPYFYKLAEISSDWQAVGVFDNLEAGDYTIMVKDGRNVEHTLDRVTLTQPESFSLEVTRTKDATCPGYNNGELDVVSTNGVYEGKGLLYEIFYEDGEEEVMPDGGVYAGAEWKYNKLKKGSYTVRVTDNNACQAKGSFVIGEPEQPEITISHNYIKAKYDNTGKVAVEIINGNGSFDYKWSLEGTETPLEAGNTKGTLRFDDLYAGNYILMVKDTASCRYEEDSEWMARHINIEEPEFELGFDEQIVPVTCNGLSDGRIRIEGTGGWGGYEYSFEGGEFTSEFDKENLPAGEYMLAVRDTSGYGYKRELRVPEPDVLTVSKLASISNVSCYGGSNGSIALDINGGNNEYFVSVNKTDWLEGSIAEGLVIGTYTVYVKDIKGCEAFVGPFTLTQPSEIVLSSDPVITKSTCLNNEGEIYASFSGGTGNLYYYWSKDTINADGKVVLMGLPQYNSPSISDLFSGRYVIKVVDDNACEKEFEFFVGDISDLDLNRIDTYPVSCFGYSDGAAKAFVSGGNQPYRFVWAGEDFEFKNDSAWNFSARDYGLFVTDSKGCSDYKAFTIGTPDELSYLVDNLVEPLCLGGLKGEMELTATGGTAPYQYLWNDGTTNRGIENVDPGTYRLSITDSHNCAAEFDFLFDYQRTITPAIGNDTLICHYNSLTLDGGDYSAFEWHSSGSFASGNRYVEVNQPATYYVKVTDADNCIGYDSLSLDVSTLGITDLLTQDVTCAGLANGQASIVVNSDGDDYSITWPDQTSELESSGYSGGEYVVSVSNRYGCSGNREFTILEPAPLTITASLKNPLCPGVSDGYIRPVASGGMGKYRYLWQHGELKSDLTKLSEGNYVLTVKDDNECSITEDFVLSYMRTISPELGGDRVLCQGNRIYLDAGEFSSYKWFYNESFVGNDTLFAADLAGKYKVVVNDEDKCVGSDSIVIGISEASLIPSFLMATSVPMGDTLLVVEVTNPKPQSIEWEIGGNSRVVESGEYFTKVIFDEEGIFPITLSSYSGGGCVGQQRKSILVTAPGKKDENGESVNEYSNMISLAVSPNPSLGKFNAQLKMHDAAPVTFYLVRIDTGQIYEMRKSQGLSEYNESFTHEGVGQLVLFAESEGNRLMEKVIVF